MKKNNAMVMNRKNNEAPGKRFGTASAAYNLIFAPVGENR